MINLIIRSLVISKQFNLFYVPELDGIRGIAILLVMLFHIGTPIFKGGFIGVDVFFVLSGFLITSLLLKEYDNHQKIALKNFYVRRALRLAPALIILLSTIALVSIFTLNYDLAKENINSILITLFYSANWVRAFNLREMGLLNHTWSLSIEEQFYIIWPFLLIILLKITKSRKHLFAVVALLTIFSWTLRIILQLKGFSADRLYNGLDTRADALLIGCILSIILFSNLINLKSKITLSLTKYIGIIALLSYICILPFISWSSWHYFIWLAFLIQILTAFLILYVFISGDNFLKRFLRLKPLVWIGSISYGLYLWHDPVFEMIRMKEYSLWIIAVTGFIITFSTAFLSFYFIEKPILKLKSKFTPASNKIESVMVKVHENSKSEFEQNVLN